MAGIFSLKKKRIGFNKRGGWNIFLKQINGMDAIFFLKIFKTILLTVAFMRVLNGLEYKTKSTLVS